MFVPLPATTLDVWISNLLSSFSKAGAAATVSIFAIATYLATRCKGRCREDSIFRSHVV